MTNLKKAIILLIVFFAVTQILPLLAIDKMAILDERPELVSVIDKTLQALTAADQDKIRHKWLSIRSDNGYQSIDVIKWVVLVSIIAGSLLAVILVWNRRLQSEIRERNLAENALKESEELFRALSQASFEAIFLSEKGICIQQNQAAEQMFGYTLSEAIGNPGTDWIVPEHRELVKKHMVAGHEDPYEVEALCKDGTTFPAEIQAKMMHYQGREVRVTALRNISLWKLTEKALKKSEEQYRDLIDSINQVLFSIDTDGQFLFISKAIEDITGYSPQEVIGTTFHQFIYTEDLQLMNDYFQLVAAGSIKNIEYRIVDKAKRILWVSSHISPIFNDKKIIGFHGMTTNIDERKQAEKALRESEFFFSQMFEQSSTSTCLYDPDGYMLRVNPEFTRMFGVSEKGIVEGKYNVFEDEAAKAAGIVSLMKKIFDEKLTNKWEFSYDIDLAAHSTGTPTSKTGTVYLEVFGYPILDDGGELKYVVLQHYDISEKKKTQEHLIQNEKMMSVGGLAAGMAHELNNPLGGMLQGIQNIQRRLSPDLKPNVEQAKELGINLDDLQLYMEKRGIQPFFAGIISSGKKAAEIISNMLQFSRKSESQMAPTNIEELIENVLELAGKDYDLKKKYDFRNILIFREFDSNLPLIPCNETEIEQVVLNLLRNATQAMMEQKQEAPSQITLRLAVDGATIKLEVEDNGPGMNDVVRRRIFEPFFTTKPIGEGTGLGLSVSYMIIVNNHKGVMEVESEVGKGTRFIIRLPLMSE